MSSFSDDSSNSNLANNDFYIKKHINAVERGNSAIFGDPVQQDNYGIIMNSPPNSHQEQAQVKNDSQLDYNKISPNEEEIRNEQQKVREEEKAEEKAEDRQQQKNWPQQVPNEQERQQVQRQKPDLNYHLSKQQQMQELKIKEQVAINKSAGQLHHNHQQNHDIVKPKKIKNIEQVRIAAEQLDPILKIVKQNTQHIDAVYNRIQNLSTLLAQFKEETSRKLEENIKATLVEKMNEINRQNSKELKDIKNSTAKAQELLEKNDRRIDRMENSIKEILTLLKRKA